MGQGACPRCGKDLLLSRCDACGYLAGDQDPEVGNPGAFMKSVAMAGFYTLIALALAFYLDARTQGRSRAPELAGALFFFLVIGALVVGVWAKCSSSRWTMAGYAWRLAVVALTLLVLSESSRRGSPPQKRF